MDIVKVRKIKLSLPQALEKIKHWCAYQERGHYETRGKLYDYGLSASDIDEALAVLVSENYLNEERFAETFARGKFRIKQWGKNKIKMVPWRRRLGSLGCFFVLFCSNCYI